MGYTTISVGNCRIYTRRMYWYSFSAGTKTKILCKIFSCTTLSLIKTTLYYTKLNITQLSFSEKISDKKYFLERYNACINLFCPQLEKKYHNHHFIFIGNIWLAIFCSKAKLFLKFLNYTGAEIKTLRKWILYIREVATDFLTVYVLFQVEYSVWKPILEFSNNKRKN